MHQEKLNRSPPSTIITTTTDTNSVAEAMTGVRNLLDSEKDMDNILYKVQLEKARLVKEKLRRVKIKIWYFFYGTFLYFMISFKLSIMTL